jgi:hypothetical protein
MLWETKRSELKKESMYTRKQGKEGVWKMEGVGKGIRDIIQLSTFIRSSSLLHIALWENVFGTCVARGGHGARRLKVL